MSKIKSPAPTKKAAPTPADGPSPRKDGIRETVESVVIAFVLAFLFRAFEAEAFVIPTGSMAPTLMGVHKDLNCEQCGFLYRVSASEEQDENTERFRADMANGRLPVNLRDQAAQSLAGQDVVSAICPNCRYQMNVDPQTPEGRQYPSYKGDRILVAKFPYDFAGPQRWDVVVFKYPETPNENYIKRCVGLPEELLKIRGGNIYTRDDEGHESIARKPADKVRAIMQTVYDNDYIVPELTKAGLPVRWQPAPAERGAWTPLDGNKEYRVDGSGLSESWLGYQHRVPTQSDWRNYERSGSFDSGGSEIAPRLVSDFYAYNAGRLRSPHSPNDPGMHWVGDLILDCTLSCESSSAGDSAQAILRLVKGGRTFDCRIDVATGKARFSIDGADIDRTAETSIRVGSTHDVSFANVDCQLLLWVDGRVVDFGGPTTYDPVAVDIPTTEDLTPVRIGSAGAALQVAHLRVLRDVYYIACKFVPGEPRPNMLDYESPPFNSNSEEAISRFLSDAEAWPRAFAHMRSVQFPLGADEYMMLGDNSPRSKDSRLWEAIDAEGRPEYYVKRDLLVGKAVFVYWPHSWNRLPGTRIPFPFFPNFARMKFVR